MDSIQKANISRPLLRKELAKMISVFASKVVQLQPNNDKLCNFTDMDNETPELQYYMRLSCKLGLMGMNADGTTPKKVFDPNEFVNRAQFATVFSRLIFGDTYNVKNETITNIQQPDYWYKNHLAALNQNKVMNNISTPLMRELRGYVMVMMMRADQEQIITRTDLQNSVLSSSRVG